GQKDTEGRALPDCRFRIDEAAGLLDDAVDRGEPKPGTLADLLGGEKRLEDVINNIRRNAGPGVADFHENIFARWHAHRGALLAISCGDIRCSQGQLSALRHSVAGVDRKIDYPLLELRLVGLDGPQVARRVDRVERYPLADQPAQQHGEIRQGVSEIK